MAQQKIQWPTPDMRRAMYTMGDGLQAVQRQAAVFCPRKDEQLQKLVGAVTVAERALREHLDTHYEWD